jgi:tungstate transport system substrate-binding protein
VRTTLGFFAAALLTLFPLESAATERLRLATTTSTETSGLLQVLLPPFEKKHGVKIDVIAVGTGKAVRLGEAGDVDVILVHAPALEEKFIADGFGVHRLELMYNDFVILGPPDDPAGISGAEDAAEALRKISETRSLFISRGDESGTHHKELEIWKAAGISPLGRWYVEVGRGMGEALAMASERRGYLLSDRSTWLSFRHRTSLALLYEGDKRLFNPYSVIAVNPQKRPHVNYDLAIAFIAYLSSPEGQQHIASFTVLGEPLFFLHENR